MGEKCKDHSVRGYLSRRSTEQLDELLEFYLKQEVCAYNGELVRIIMDVLWEREKSQQYPVSREIIELYNRLYGCPGDMDE